MIGDVIPVERFQKSVRSVIKSESRYGHVVGVHYSVGKSEGLPLGDGDCRFFRRCNQKKPVAFRCSARNFGIVAGDYVVGKRADALLFTAIVKTFKRTEAHVGLRDPEHHRGGFSGFSIDFLRASHHAESSCGRNSQMVESLAS